MTTTTLRSTPPPAAFEDAEHGLQLGAELLDGLGGEGAPGFRFELARPAVLLDFLSRALDRVLLRVQQMFDQHDELDLAALVYAVARSVLCGIQEAELALPVAEHVRLQVGELAHFADREELLDRLRGSAAADHVSALSSRSMRSLIA